MLDRGRDGLQPDLLGRRVVISAGGTREELDPVRFLGNWSSGLQGYALAATAVARGADVTEGLGLHPSPEADKYALIRRVSLDLVGLPPTPEEADAFANDPAPMRTKSWSTGSWPARNTASAGRAAGWTWLVMPTPMGSRRTGRGPSGHIATG